MIAAVEMKISHSTRRPGDQRAGDREDDQRDERAIDDADAHTRTAV